MAEFTPITTQEQLDKIVSERTSEYTNEISGLNERVKSYEMLSVKERVAREVGLPYEVAARLNGEDEKAIRKDAESLLGFMKETRVAPLASTETEVKDEDAGIRKMLRELTGKGE